MTQKKIAIIGTNGLPARYGGFETLAEYLAKGLSSEYELYCYCSKTPKKERLKEYQNTKLLYLPFRANGWQSIIYDSCSIIYSLFRHDILLVLGSSGTFVLPLGFLYKKKIILNIGGIEWQKIRGGHFTAKFEIWVKKRLEYIGIKSSDQVIVDNQVLHDYVIKQYNITPALAEYGGDHAVLMPVSSLFVKKYPFLQTEYDVTVSRAQEDMNIHMVIEAYKNVLHRKIVIISNWGISDYGIKLKKTNINKYQNIILLDAIYDLKLLNAIRGNASIYLHTHSLCGTAPSLVEAMYLGLPVICFDVPTNRASTEGKALYFKDIQALISILNKLDGQKLAVLRNDMREISHRRYIWSRIIEVYRGVIKAERQGCGI
jgi:glycosyltransferase involved in cell wall biosynthesis